MRMRVFAMSMLRDGVYAFLPYCNVVMSLSPMVLMPALMSRVFRRA